MSFKCLSFKISFKVKTSIALISMMLIALTLSGCKDTPPKASDSAKRFELKGKVVSADQAEHKVTIAHEEIPGYMEAMTMPFTLLEDWVYGELKPGALIQATLVVDQNRSWLENPSVTTVDPNVVGKEVETSVEPKVGDAVPDFNLTNQDGKKISLKKYAGRTVLLTFIYTRCPMPDQCPLMSTNFAFLNQQLAANATLKGKVSLLSISVDPTFDKPNVLREYGLKYINSTKPDAFAHWDFATGSNDEVKKVGQFFGLNYWPEKDQVIHNLRTVMISADGKVAQTYRGNEWKPDQMLKDLEKQASISH
jgi:protein SCO1/2